MEAGFKIQRPLFPIEKYCSSSKKRDLVGLTVTTGFLVNWDPTELI